MATKKPKVLRYPKKPKTSAPLSTWERFDKRCKEVDKKNRENASKYKSAINGISSAKKKKESLIKKYSK
jgi:hypothetical protein